MSVFISLSVILFGLKCLMCGLIVMFSGKKRRLTFMECNNDINSMIDLAKVADLVRTQEHQSFQTEFPLF